MKHILFVSILLCVGVKTFAQFETVLPLMGNYALPTKPDTEKQLTKKASTLPKQLPIVEHFANDSLNKLFWVDSNVTVAGKTARFNAQNFGLQTYSGGDNSFGETDILTTNAINLIGLADRFYVSFDYETGNTWQIADSLVLQVQNAAGVWVSLWRSARIATAFKTEIINFPLGLLYQHASFQLRFVCYSTRSLTNTESFKLYNFVFAQKPTLPYYENVFWNSIQTSRNDWSKMQGTQRTDNTIGWGNVIKLDAFDEQNNPYNNGFSDTIQGHSIDLSRFVPSDSVYFRFYYKALVNSTTDTLLLQLRNNLGVWVNQYSIAAANAGIDYNMYVVNVNRNSFNHSNFQYRIIARGVANDTAKWYISGINVSKKLLLPFVDDFSSSTTYPDQNRWIDRSVFVNNRFPINPPSLNVATFDGLDAYATPYGFGRGYCDSLTSLPIKLNGLSLADSVYLSFYVQPKGLGMIPDLGDTLSLFGRFSAQSPDSFNLLWRAAPSAYPTDSFVQIKIALPQPYLHDEFQLRFINKGSRSGNLSHWHVDYVYLNKSRTQNDAITDVAIQNDPSPLLKKFASIPYTHFKTAAANYTSDTQYFAVKNNSNLGYAIDYGRELYDQNFSRIDSFGSIISVMPAYETRSANIKKTVNIAGNFNTDSAVVWSRYYTRLGSTADNIPSNDTLWQSTYFGNYYAYDDGTAEAGYAIKNSPGKVALRYPLIKNDSIYGLSMYFNRGVADVSSQPFNVMVWKKIDLTTEEVLLRIPANAIYFNERNKFYNVKFEQPIYVENEVYIGWEQNSIFELNVGLDLNFKINDVYADNPEMFYNVQNLWQPTELNGALMMRPIVGKWVDPPVGVKQVNIEQVLIQVYPNPTNGRVAIQTENNHPLIVEVYDLAGRNLSSFSNQTQLDLSNLPMGIYFLKIEDRITHQTTTKKIILQP